MSERVYTARDTADIDARVRKNDAMYLSFGGALGPIDYRSAIELVTFVLTGIGLMVAASMGAEWWVYLVIVLLMILIVYAAVRRV